MLFANNANTTLASSLTNVATTMSVTSASAFPSPTGSQYFYCTLADAATQTTIEIVKVTAVSGTTFTIVRGQDGTSGTSFAAGDVVSLRLVRASLNDFPKLDETNTFSQTQTFSQTIVGSINGNAATATNLAGGSSYAVPYQTGSNTTSFLAAGTSGSVLMTLGSATAPIWVLASSLSVSSATTAGNVTGTVAVANGGTGLTSLTAGYIPYGNGTSAFSSSSAFQFDGTNLKFGTNLTNGIYFGSSSQLNDYEEGTWSPSFYLGATQASYSARVGTYRKIGNIVTVTCSITLSSTNSGSGGLSIQGLPYTVKSGNDGIGNLFVYSGWQLLVPSGSIVLQAAGNGTTVYLYIQTTTGSAQLTSGAVTNSAVMEFCLTYIV